MAPATDNISIPSLILITSILLPLLASPPVSFAAACNAQDKKALQGIKAAFPGQEDFTFWTDATACCAWFGVRCDTESGRVLQLEISNSPTLSGSIPNAIADLSSLTRLALSGLPGLTGHIPQFLTHLQSLSELVLSGNSLSGPVPSFLSRIESLQALDLSNNKLTGSIPGDLGNLKKLFSIKLSHNQLTGSIPAALGRLAAVAPELDLSNNRLSGNIPPELGQPIWSYIDLSNNNLSGDASVLFGWWKSTTKIYLQNNGFKFDFGKVVFPPKLTDLVMSDNKIFGSIPDSINKLNYLRVLDLSKNRLCKQIPLGEVTARFNKNAFADNACLCGGPEKPCRQ